MKILILSTGEELLNGQITDTNAAWLANELYARGLHVEQIHVVGDHLPTLVTEISNALDQFDLTIAGGGLGPTIDDLSAEAAARAIDAPLIHHPEAEKVVRARFETLGRAMPQINLKQAMLPAGCTVLDNPHGTAPGFMIERKGRRAVFLPGVPFEMKPMFLSCVVPLLPAPCGRQQLVFKIYGMGESAVQECIAHLLNTRDGLTVSFRVTFPEIALTITAESRNIDAELETEIATRLGNTVFARSPISLPEAVAQRLAAKGLSIAAAESCTGGLLADSLTDIPGISSQFAGGVIAYNNRIKAEVLNVPQLLLDTDGAVSESVAISMARGVQELFRTDVGISTTGIAGPGGASDDRPVGTLHIAVAVKDRIHHGHHLFKGYNRTQMKRASTWAALKLVFDHLEEPS